MYKQVLVNDTLNLLRGKSVRFILEDGDLRMIANLVAVIDELGLEYDPEGMVYRHPEPKDDFWSYDEDAPEPERDAKSSHTNISRQQLAKELEPGLNALFGAEYAQAEAARLERNRKAREKYHAKKGKVNGRKRKTKGSSKS